MRLPLRRSAIVVAGLTLLLAGAAPARADVITIGAVGTLTTIDDLDPSAGVVDFFFVNFTPFAWLSELTVTTAAGDETFGFSLDTDGVPSSPPRLFSVLENLTAASFSAALPTLPFLLDGTWWQLESPASALLDIGPFTSSGDFYSAEITALARQVTDPAPVPEPSTFILLATSAAVAGGRRLFRRARPA